MDKSITVFNNSQYPAANARKGTGSNAPVPVGGGVLRVMEEWRPVVGYEKFYQVSDHGRIWSNRRSRLIKQKTTKQGYKILTTAVKENGSWVSKCHCVHRVVAFAFIKNSQKKPHINHKDGDKANNEKQNLEWCTRKENGAHAIAHGLYRIGEKHPRSVMTRKTAAKIRLLRGKVFARVIAKQYNISLATTYRILQGKIYV